MSFTPQKRTLADGTVRYRGGFRHPVTHKAIYRIFDYFGEAEAWAISEEDRARRMAREGAPAQATAAPAPTPKRWAGPTVGEYGAACIARRTIGNQTRRNYTAYLKGLAVKVHPDRPAPASVPVGLLTREDVEQWVTDSRAARVGAVSINYRLDMLKMLYRDLFDSDEHFDDIQRSKLRNPTRNIKHVPTDDTPDYVLTEEEEAEFLAAAREHSPQLADAAIVALDAGLRWQEVYGLRASAVSGDYLMVTHVVERGTVELRAFTKGKRPRVVPMTERLAATLAPLVKAARKRGGPNALLFPVHGDPARVRKDRRDELLDGKIVWDYGNFRKREWLPVLASIGAAKVKPVPTGRTNRKGEPIYQRRILDPAYGFHSLRHTYGSRLAAVGVPRAEIAELMGHADERTTGRYIHAGDDGRRLALVRAALGRTPTAVPTPVPEVA